MTTYALARDLLAADSESDAIRILQRAGHWDAPGDWRNFGDQENNFSTIGNQQALPEAALVEKLVNSIDAVLMLECRKRGIDPEGPNAPRTIREAVATLLGIKDGNLAELTARELTEHAGRIGLAAVGSKSSPSLVVFDQGEGQSPPEFPDTLLSLGKSNKLKIPFVQGKFNMGGTGVLQFCGRHNLQLVISRRHPALAPTDERWGITVVRREDPSGGLRSSVYRYLAPGGRVLAFDRADLSVLPPADGGKPIGLPHGTIFKLYSYQLPGGLKTNILFDLRNRLSCLMPGVAFPVRLYERRDYKGHSFEANMEGLSARLDRDTRDNLEFEPTTHAFDAEDQRLTAKVYAFKRDHIGSSQSEKFRDREGIIFTINGQAHGHLEKSFFRRQRVNMSYLAEDILVIVDATTIDGRSREDLFMNSRDRLRDGTLRRAIERELEALVAGHDLLRELKQRRREQSLSKKLLDDKALEVVLRDVIKRSPALSALLISGTRLGDPFRTDTALGSRLDFQGQRFPTFFKLMRGEEQRSAHIGQRFRVTIETDAENSYFDRDIDPGQWVLILDDQDVSGSAVFNLVNGIATLNVHLPKDAKVRDVFEWQLEVSDVSRVVPFTLSFERTIQPPAIPGGGAGSRRPPAERGRGERETAAQLAIPPVTSVRREQWSSYSFNRESAMTVRTNDGAHEFFVNVDNVYLLHEIRSAPAKRDSLTAQFKYGLALFGLAFARAYVDRPDDFDLQGELENAAEAFGPFLLPMISGLAALEESVEADPSGHEAEGEHSEDDGTRAD